jgi:hypothetical protein
VQSIRPVQTITLLIKVSAGTDRFEIANSAY